MYFRLFSISYRSGYPLLKFVVMIFWFFWIFSIEVCISLQSFLSKSGIKARATFFVDILREISSIKCLWVTIFWVIVKQFKLIASMLSLLSSSDCSSYYSLIIKYSCVFLIASLNKFLIFCHASLILWNYVLICNLSRLFFISTISFRAIFTSSSNEFIFIFMTS